MLVEFLMQLNMSYQIVKTHRKTATHGGGKFKMERKNAILRLVLAELCEGIVPLAYIICFSMAFYGPNAKLIGNVKNGCWQFEAVDDANLTFVFMLVLFAIDLLCFSLNASIVWWYCSVNLFKEICNVVQKYWYIMAVKLTFIMQSNFFVNDVNLGLDTTHQFSWVTNNQNFSSICNSTNI